MLLLVQSPWATPPQIPRPCVFQAPWLGTFQRNPYHRFSFISHSFRETHKHYSIFFYEFLWNLILEIHVHQDCTNYLCLIIGDMATICPSLSLCVCPGLLRMLLRTYQPSQCCGNSIMSPAKRQPPASHAWNRSRTLGHLFLIQKLCSP